MESERDILLDRSLDEGVARYASAMGHRFGPLFHLLGLGLLLRGLRFEEHSAERIRRASELGPVVYTLYYRSLFDLLALNKVLSTRRLPLASFCNGLRTAAWMPLPTFWRSVVARLRHLGRSAEPLRSGWLASLLASGSSAALFMLGPRAWRDLLHRRPRPDVAEALLRAQQRSEAAIQVVPVVIIWSRRPMTTRSEAERILLGSEERPGRFSRLWAALTRRGTLIVQAGEPLDLARFSEHYAEDPPQRRTRILRVVLRRYLYREQSTVRGPRTRSHAWMRRLVLSSRAVRDAAQHEIKATGHSEERVLRKVERSFDKIAARMSYSWVRLAALATRLLWNRIYSGVDVLESDIDRIRQLQRRGGVVLLPCHRSHLDYLLVSSILYQHGVVLPHIAAGINLSFWPAGPIFRRLGAFFVKRSFRGDRIFPAVFDQYLRQLVREGYPLEFFIEGGRSRTGKLLPPKLGLLGMVIDAADAVKRDDFDLALLPINICYEQIAEEGAYARELSGEKKKSESISQVIRARRVLRARYGRVYIRLGEALSVKQTLLSADRPWSEMDREHRGEALQRVGESVLHRINQQALVLPTSLAALALLAHHRRGIRREALFARVERFRSFLERTGAPMSASMAWPGWAVEEAIGRFVGDRKLRVFEDQDGPVYQLAEDGRITLEYYKNNLLHFFVPAALLALALRTQLRDHGIPRSGILEAGIPIDFQPARRGFRTLAWWFRYEFVFDPETTTGKLLDMATEQLADYGALQGDRGELRVVDADRLHELANLLVNFVESYWLALRGAQGLARKGARARDLEPAIRQLGEGTYAVEEIRRAEALSSVTLKNALRAFKEEGILGSGEDGGLTIDSPACAEALAQLRQLMD